MPLLRWSNPGHDTRRASSLVREAGCREINLHIRRWENNVLDIPFYRSLLRKMPLLRWSNPGHDTRRASSLVREAGCREINLHIRRWENNVLDIPFYRAAIAAAAKICNSVRKRCTMSSASKRVEYMVWPNHAHQISKNIS